MRPGALLILNILSNTSSASGLGGSGLVIFLGLASGLFASVVYKRGKDPGVRAPCSYKDISFELPGQQSNLGALRSPGYWTKINRAHDETYHFWRGRLTWALFVFFFFFFFHLFSFSVFFFDSSLRSIGGQQPFQLSPVHLLHILFSLAFFVTYSM